MPAPRLFPDAGPPHAPSGVPFAGLFPGPVWRYELGPEPATVRLLSDGPEVAGGTELRVAVFPELHPDFAACHIGFGLPDQHGHLLGATGTSCLVADQWNLLDLDLSPLAGEALTLELALPSGAGRGWLQLLGHGPAPEEPDDVVARAVTTRGTNSSFEFSRGNTFPGACLPHGFVFVTPVTDARTDAWIYRWAADGPEPKLQALALCHQPSPWLRDRDACQVMPWFGSPAADARERALAFDHREEVARPDRYEVRLHDPRHPERNVRAELVPTEHGAAMRFTFDGPAGERGILLDQPGPAQRTWQQLPDGRLAINWWLQASWVYAETVQPVEVHTRRRFWQSARDLPLAIRLPIGDTLEIRLAQSHIDLPQARHSFELELGRRSFEAVAETAHDAWADLLGRLEIRGGNREQRTAAWSNLAQLFSWPSAHHENAGTADRPRPVYASPFRTDRPVVEGELFVNNGYWDTYRTAWPMYHLLMPRHATPLLDGIVQAYRDSGWMSRWSAPGHHDVMVGTSSDAIFADAAAHGIAFDQASAYASALRNALVPSAHPQTGRKGIARGRFVGWIDRDTPEGFSWSMENANCDAAIALWSARLAADHTDPRHREYRANAAYFANRALAWPALFDERTGFLRGREASGRFGDVFDPLEWGGDYTETNAWGMLFSPVWDGAGLAAVLGGEQALGARLDQARATPETATRPGRYGYPIHEMAEARALRLGQFAISNQPAHHMPWMYLHAGRPDACQAMVREICDRVMAGSEIGQGYPGDEDNGEMSAWQLFALFGLYPLQVASGQFALSTPTFDEVVWHRDDGTTLRIAAHGQGDHIASVLVNGRPWHEVMINVATLHANCTIEVTRSAAPTGWGRDSRPMSLSSWAPPRRPDRSSDATMSPALPELVDDEGRAVRTIPAGRPLELRWREPFVPLVAAVTFDEPPAGTWKLEVHTATGWLDAGPVIQPVWPDQTTPQPLPAEPVDAVRLVGEVDLSLRQVEVF